MISELTRNKNLEMWGEYAPESSLNPSLKSQHSRNVR